MKMIHPHEVLSRIKPVARFHEEAGMGLASLGSSLLEN
jgi:hypothetical protein